MISRLTATATLVALLAAATLAGAASARGFRLDLGSGAETASTRSAQVRIVELPRVVVVGRRLSAER